MFTGIITAIGTIDSLTPIGAGRDMRATIACPWPDTATIPLGASIACSGCCLTAVEVSASHFAVEASAESLSLTTLGTWRPGTRINLERSLRIGDELGGHLVSGHVDGLAEVLSVTPDHGSQRWQFRAPHGLARFIARKGSVALDGVSLTVNEVDGDVFGVNLIFHTVAVTTFADRAQGDQVNLEIDTLARYVARLAEFTPAAEPR
jgi:riboflavin synthase